MWQLWWRGWAGRVKDYEGGAWAHFFANPVVGVGTAKVVLLTCYEQLLVLPILQSAFYHTDAIVAAGNGWWTEGTSVIDIQKASSKAGARLYCLKTDGFVL
ncbi:hypothetical protein MUU53_04400 [Rhizobium lemnae]|nr:nitrilase-related carbon-nitrogen hydrolase [Rhizobium lemnae]MCJ8507148.1 hypothetical protein [Rhizobium lemnae]